MWGGAWGATQQRQRWCGVESWMGNGILSEFSSLYVKSVSPALPHPGWHTFRLLSCQICSSKFINQEAQTWSVWVAKPISILGASLPITLASLMLNLSVTLPPFKTDRLPTASLPSLHTLYLASLLFFKHDGLTVFSDNLWLINEQPSSWIKVFYEKWCPSSFLTLPKYVNIFQLQTWSDPPGGSRVTLTLKIYFSSTDKINA